MPDRNGHRNGDERLHAGALEIRPEEQMALVDGRPLALTRKELRVLAELARHEEHILTREQIYEAVWGGSLRGADRSVDVYVSRVRRKLDAALPGHSLIFTHSGIGYRFSPGA